MKYLQLKLAEMLARLLPRRMCYGLARRVADLYVLLDRRGRDAVIGNHQRIHKQGGVVLSQRALRVLARENFLNFAKYLVDFFQFLHYSTADIHALIDFGDTCATLDKLLAQGKGLVIFSAHLGNWELGAGALALRGYKFNVVALWVPDPKLNALYQSYRNSRQLNPIPFGRAARGCLAALRRNEIVAVVGDRDFTPSRDTVEFFGQPARLPNGPAKLALASGAPLLPVFLVRCHDDTFKYVVLDPIFADRTRDSVADVMGHVARALETVIRQHSEQWFMFHDLWNLEVDRKLATKIAFGEQAADELKPPAPVVPTAARPNIEPLESRRPLG